MREARLARNKESAILRAMGKVLFLASLAVLCGCGVGEASPALGQADANDAEPAPKSDGSVPGEAGVLSGTRLIVVHTGEPKLQPFRVCVSDTALPEPSDPTHPMPQSNYPGIAIGGAAYVGVVTSSTVSMTLYDALTLANENRSAESCGTLRTDTTLPAFAHEDVDTTGLALVLGELNVVGIYGAVGQTKAIAAPLDSSFTTGVQPLQIAFGHLSPDHQGAKINAAFSTRDGGALVPLGTVGFGEVGALTMTSFPLDASTSSYDDYGVTLASPAQFFSLTDVAHGTDPTQAPSALLGGRTNFAFVLVGYDSVPDGGSPGQALHVVAIPTPQ